MKKSDEMIFVLSLYNKISDQNPSLSEKDVFKKLKSVCEKLIRENEIKFESYQDCIYALFPNERKKQIEVYKQQGADEKAVSSPYSVDVNTYNISKMVDDILQDKPVALHHSAISPSIDPCSCCMGRSSC